MADNEGSMGSSNIANQTSNSASPNIGGTNKKTKIVKDVIAKGKTITGKTPDTIIINPVMEAAEKTAIMAYGRFNPPTTGHEKLIHKVEDVAREHKGTAHIIASHSEGNSKNPVPKDKKVGYLKKIAAEGTHVSSSDKEHPSFLHQAKKLHDAGHQHLVMVAGSDRVQEYQKKLDQYNGKEGHYHFKSIKVVSAGHRDPDAEGTEGMSGTKMREHARSGNMKAFKSGLPKALHPHASEIAGHIKAIKEEVDDVFNSFILETAIEEIGAVYDQVMSEDIDRLDTHLRDRGTTSLTNIYKNDTPGEPKIKKTNKSFKEAFKATDREAVMRSGQDRKKEDLVPRSGQNRKSTNAAFRQQSIVKKIIDESVNSAGTGGIRGLGYVTGDPLVDDEGENNYVGNNIAGADTHNDIIKSRVNSHFAMHVASKAKNTVKEEIDRSAFLYMEPKAPKNTFAQCGTCESFLPGKQRCSVFSANDKVVAEGSCGLYVHGKPHDDQPFTNSATPKTAGYVDESVRCENCSWYSKGKCGLYEELNKKMGDAFKLDPNVNEKGCCNAWEGKSLNEQETYSIINEISIELIGKVNKARLEKPAKTAAANITRNRAVKKAWLKSRVGIAKEQKEVDEDLRDWFKDKWVRMDTKGNIKGDCAREPGEGKPKCLPLAKVRAMDKEDRATAARRKRREDPVADRPGKGSAPINVRTEAANPAQQAAIAIALIKAGKKKGKVSAKEEFEFIEEGNTPTNPELWSRAKSLAKSKFDVYPSAYANGWAAKWYKSKGGGWKSGK